ncbi:MAG: hypothetical protein QOE86_2185 [Solirubrobacteraceae bacterium]|jgi:hypothetical protein|nr:hypothetical protein [Solirubrobacteraceae bacterium]
MSRFSVLAIALSCALLLPASAASALASHDGWPPTTMLVMNKTDANRPLDARPGLDPFGGQDPHYRCDAVHRTSPSCAKRFDRQGRRFVITSRPGHARLLGGHGDDVLHASPWGDVLWGDYKPSGQPSSQHDTLIGGDGPDFIYASHGHNVIEGGAGTDAIHGHFGRGRIDCGPGRDVVYVAKRHRRRWKLSNCEVVSTKTGQSAPRWLKRGLPW